MDALYATVFNLRAARSSDSADARVGREDETINTKAMDQKVCSLDVRVNGVKTHFVTAGDGAPLVLVHGGDPGTGGDHGWRRNIPALAEHFRVYALDRIGSGLTDKPLIDYSDQVLADHLAGFIDALCLEQVHIMGNSMGAYGAARYAVDHPERVRKMVLVASGSIATAMGLEHRPTDAWRAIRRAVEEPTRDNVRAMLEGLVQDRAGITDEVVDERIERITLPGAQEANRSMQTYRGRLKIDPNLRQQYSLTHRLPELTIPAIMVWGKKDGFAPIELGYQLRDMLPNLAAFHVFENSGHQAQNDEVDKFNQTVIEFLKEPRNERIR